MANRVKPQPSAWDPTLKAREAKYAPMMNAARWTTRKKAGGNAFRKLPMGIQTKTSFGWGGATRRAQALAQDVAEDQQHAHEDDEVGVEAVGAEQAAQGRVGRRVVDAVDQRANAQDQETGSHTATLLLILSKVNNFFDLCDSDGVLRKSGSHRGVFPHSGDARRARSVNLPHVRELRPAAFGVETSALSRRARGVGRLRATGGRGWRGGGPPGAP